MIINDIECQRHPATHLAIVVHQSFNQVHIVVPRKPTIKLIPSCLFHLSFQNMPCTCKPHTYPNAWAEKIIALVLRNLPRTQETELAGCCSFFTPFYLTKQSMYGLIFCVLFWGVSQSFFVHNRKSQYVSRPF